MALPSRIPVPVRSIKSSNVTSKEKEWSEKQTSLPQFSNNNKLIKQSQYLPKPFVNKSKPQENKTVNYSTCKTNKKCSVSQTSNSDKTLCKNSNMKVKELENKTATKVKDAPTVKSYTKNNISKNMLFVSQTSNVGKTAATDFQRGEKEHVKKSCQPEKLNAKNVTYSKKKFTSSKGNTQIDGKVSFSAKPNKTGISKIISEKENQETHEASCFPDQKDIKFEPNEFCRNMILSGRELSPGICNIMHDIRLSSVQAQRPSAYRKVEVNPNSLKDALQAIAEASARRASRNVPLQKDMKFATQSIFQERNSVYTPCADPKEEVMRSLEALKARRLQKSALKSSKKKVTFNLHIEEYTANVNTNSEPMPSKNAEVKLTQINERSEENTPRSPTKNENEIVNIENNKHPFEYQESCIQIKTPILSDNMGESIHSSKKESFETCTSAKSTTAIKDVQAETCVLPVEPPFKEANPVPFPSGSIYGYIKFSQEAVNNKRTSGILFERNTNEQRAKKSSQVKLCTPKPISFYSNSRLVNDIPSPQLLTGKTFLPSLAPIYTPLALKSIAKSSVVSPDAADLSPVRLKLDFTAAENDTPVKENFVRRCTLSNLENIVTVQQKLDDLADQECSFWLPESIRVVCGRHLQNPIAVTLSEGDEMHFLPIRL